MPTSAANVALDHVREAARGCTNCPLYKLGTQTVFGEGPAPAPIMMVGEQPGDKEDLEGRPFVGPAGQMLDRALADAGIERRDVYVTNAVKHFKWEPRGKRRLHKKPIEREIAACRPWLTQEIALVQPKLIVCLGATAAHRCSAKISASHNSEGLCCSTSSTAKYSRRITPLRCCACRIAMHGSVRMTSS